MVSARKSENLEPIRVIPQKNSRFAYLSHNSRVFFSNRDWFETFYNDVMKSDRHSNNVHLEYLSSLTDKTSLHCHVGVFSALWEYFIRPSWSFFSNNHSVKNGLEMIQKLINFTEKGAKSKTPLSFLTTAPNMFGDLIKEPSDESLDFCSEFIASISKGELDQNKISNKLFKGLVKIVQDFFERANKKYNKDYKDLLDSFKDINQETTQMISLPFTNQLCESIFGILKDERIHSNTRIQQVFSRTFLVMNGQASWLERQDDWKEILSQGMKLRKQTQEAQKLEEIEHELEYVNMVLPELIRKSNSSD